MSDRELLELAAKAAGIEGEVTEYGVCLKHGNIWRPHTDDGDALRLAVKLGLVFDATRNQTWCGKTQYDIVIPHGTDPYAATRRAIVRAAAEEIKRNMK